MELRLVNIYDYLVYECNYDDILQFYQGCYYLIDYDYNFNYNFELLISFSVN